MEFDVTHQPLSTEQLTQIRNGCEQNLTLADRRERIFKYFFLYPLGLIGLAIIVNILIFSSVQKNILVGIIALPVLAGFGSKPFFYTPLSIILPASMIVSGINSILFYLSSHYQIPGLGLAILIISIIYPIAAAYIAELLYESKRKQAKAILEDLSEINATDHPHHCINYVWWCKQDPILKAYQNSLFDLNRIPTLGEFKAVEEWVIQEERRRDDLRAKQEAKEAFSLMTQPL